MYSYKRPRHKPLFDRMTKLWFIFSSLMFLAVLGYGIYLYHKSSRFEEQMQKALHQKQTLQKEVDQLRTTSNQLHYSLRVTKEIERSNRLLNNSIQNLFHLIPDQIILTKVEMQQDSLRLEGLSLTKDAYRLLLEPALKSIFDKSEVKFHFEPTIGRYKFVSHNQSIPLVKRESSQASSEVTQ